MAIPNHTIITKMLHELQPLEKGDPSRQEIEEHVGNVKLMCELLLENVTEESGPDTVSGRSLRNASNVDTPRTSQGTSGMTEEEYRAMIGKDAPSQANDKATSRSPSKSKYVNHDEANGESLFDF